MIKYLTKDWWHLRASVKRLEKVVRKRENLLEHAEFLEGLATDLMFDAEEARAEAAQLFQELEVL